MGMQRVFLADDAATAALGARLAGELQPGAVVLLEGGLGAGKTALARALIRTLMGEPELEVPSPSFALVQPYAAPGQTVLHADLYRLREARELDELGLFDDPAAIVVVEWPERAVGLAARATVRIGLAIPPDHQGRVAEITR
jgi:tRNA threonylcarbamoyl adenosine modification protein YjeE